MILVPLGNLLLTALLLLVPPGSSDTAISAKAAKQIDSNQPAPILADQLLDAPFSGDNRARRLVLAMTNGTYKNEQEPGPFAGPQWTGEFELQLYDANGAKLSATSLNAFVPDPLFQHPFPVKLADYNNDGHLDFAIGQYLSSNLYTFKLFTIVGGKIELLPVEPGGELISSERDYSVLFTAVGKDAFRTVYYDNSVGTYFERIYQWKGQAFVKVHEAKIGEEYPHE